MLERCELRLLLRHGVGLLHRRLQRTLLGRVEHRHVARNLLEVRGDQRSRLQQVTPFLHQTVALRVDLVGPCDLRRALAIDVPKEELPTDWQTIVELKEEKLQLEEAILESVKESSKQEEMGEGGWEVA